MCVVFVYTSAGDDVIKGLTIGLSLTQLDDSNWQFTIEMLRLLMDQQQLVEYERYASYVIR